MAKWANWTKMVHYPRPHILVFYRGGKDNFEKIPITKGSYTTHGARLADFLEVADSAS
jgi:hypothetical protein